jgi:hypothetical protein
VKTKNHQNLPVAFCIAQAEHGIPATILFRLVTLNADLLVYRPRYEALEHKGRGDRSRHGARKASSDKPSGHVDSSTNGFGLHHGYKATQQTGSREEEDHCTYEGIPHGLENNQ